MKNVKKEIIVLGVIIGLIAIGALVSRWLIYSGIKIIHDTTTTEYRDEKFGYRFVYPNTWTVNRLTLSPGYTKVIPSDGRPFSIIFWYKDSKAIKNIADLESFVKDDAKYGESEQGIKTIKIFPQRIGDMDGFAWDYQDRDGTISRAYYIADFNPNSDQSIFVWTVVILNKTNSLNAALADKDVQSILDSYRLIK